MRKKVLIILTILPIILLFVLFAITQRELLYKDVPVAKIEFNNKAENGILTIDLSKYNNDYSVKANIYPLIAKNKDYEYKIEPVNGSEFANVRISEDKKLIINSLGKAKITVISKQGGYKDSFILNVKSSELLDYEPLIFNIFDENISNSSENKDYVFILEPGTYSLRDKKTPDNLSEVNIDWIIPEDNKIIYNEGLNEIEFLSSGQYNLKAIAKNEKSNKKIEKNIKVIVKKIQTSKNILINGRENYSYVISKEDRKISAFIEVNDGKKY